MTLFSLTEFSIYLDQRPGELAGLLGILRAAGVTVHALAVSEHNGRGLARLLGEPIPEFRRVAESLADRGIGPVVEAQVLGVNIDERPSVLIDLTTALADHAINLRYAYTAPARGGSPARLIFRVDDLDAVMSKLMAIDWPRPPSSPSPTNPTTPTTAGG